MILTLVIIINIPPSIPRESGDDPVFPAFPHFQPQYSPRERG